MYQRIPSGHHSLKFSRRFYLRQFIFVLAAICMMGFLVFSFIHRTRPTDAVSYAGFSAGNIMSDYVMSNYNSMSETDISNFMHSKNPCNDTNLSKVGHYLSQGIYHIENGHFVCLADEVFDGETVPHIIASVAREYRINPQVILVLLEKEQGLITDTYPYHNQMAYAFGYGCDDTVGCHSEYAGFRKQVSRAAGLFREVLDGGWTNYPVGWNYVKYHPNSACGGTNVFIENRATSALYRYTPYQPNSAALAAGYGLGDSCSSYGNRNFYGYFSDWFGSPKDDGRPSIEQIYDSANKVSIVDTEYGIDYRSHLANYGWLNWVNNGHASGSVGYSVQMESFGVRLWNTTGVEYRAHVSNIGWMDYKKDGEDAGTTGRGLKLEAIQIRLTGDMAKLYDIYYRAHVADIGWQDWVSNDAIAGIVGESKQIEAIQIRLVEKKNGLGPDYQAHVQNLGWNGYVNDGGVAGTTGRFLQMEALQMRLSSSIPGDINYRAHVADYGWMNWTKNGAIAGTTGQSRRMEAIQISLPENLAQIYDVFYRAHVSDYGWMNWVKNGDTAGTTGQFRRMEAVQVKIVKK